MKALANADASVILACRSLSKGNDAKAEILKSNPKAKINVMELNLASFKSIQSFVDRFNEQYDHLDVLINNAGIMALPERLETENGIEIQLGTNHFGHYLLTALLFPKISKNGRIVNHASTAHSFATSEFPFGDFQSKDSYGAWTAYGNSKAANLMFTDELNKRLLQSGNPRNIKAISVHPGYSATNLQTDRFPFWEQMNNLFAMKAEYGAQPQLLAAVSTDPVITDASKGTYIGPKFITFGPPKKQSTGRIYTDEKQSKLWELSVQLTKHDIDFSV